MALAVPFILCHPTEATVLSDLGDVAAGSGSSTDVEAFRAGVAKLLATAQSAMTAPFVRSRQWRVSDSPAAPRIVSCMTTTAPWSTRDQRERTALKDAGTKEQRMTAPTMTTPTPSNDHATCAWCGDDLASPSELAYEVVVIGGGAAGLSAALVLGRARRSVLVVDGGSPRNAPAAHMQGFLSRDGMPPSELLEVGRTEVRRYGVEIVFDDVVGAEPGFTLQLANGAVVTAERLLLAAGVTDEIPAIAGPRERWGRDVLHCPYCHGWEVRDQALAVLGTHPGAVDHAMLVRQWSHDVVYFPHTCALTVDDAAALSARGIKVVEGELAGVVVADDRLHGVLLRDGQTVPRDAVFIRTQNVPRGVHLLRSLGCALDDSGFPVVDSTGRTSVPGVWAAGNSTDPRASVITSAGMAAAAAMAINADLVRSGAR